MAGRVSLGKQTVYWDFFRNGFEIKLLITIIVAALMTNSKKKKREKKRKLKEIEVGW